MCVLDVCGVCDQCEFMAPVMVFNLWICPGFIFELCG